MEHWIKRGGMLLAITVFFAIFISMLFVEDPFSLPHVLKALSYAFVAGSGCWFLGFIAGDILLKGILNDIGNMTEESIVEGGMLQRLHMMKSASTLDDERAQHGVKEAKNIRKKSAVHKT